MAELLNLDEALDVAKQMRNHFRAFEKLYEVLLFIAEKHQEAKEAEKQKSVILAEIPTIQDRIKQLEKEHATRKDTLDAEFRARQDGYERVLNQVKKETDEKVNELHQGLAMIQAEVEGRIARAQQGVEAREREATDRIGVIQNRVTQVSAELHAKVQEMTDHFNRLRIQQEEHLQSFAKDEADAQRRVLAVQAELEAVRNRVSKL